MSPQVKQVVVTGGAGHIAYQLLFRIASGELLGKEQPISLGILEIPGALPALQGVAMELQDCAFPLLKEIRIGSDPMEIFDGADIAILVGAKPRGPGMERKELLFDNAKIFIEQGRALNEVAKRSALVLVVGNPCNTNCLIAMSHAPNIPRSQFHAMTRLDQNRATYQLAARSGVALDQVSHVTIWGNHSSTQVPDFVNAKIGGASACEVIKERGWCEGTFVETVQKRGAAIIAARGLSSAASAANAAIDAIRSLLYPTPAGQWFSSAVFSEGNSYGIDENLVFSFPCRSHGDGRCEIVPNVPWDHFLQERIKKSELELLEERELIADLLAKVAV